MSRTWKYENWIAASWDRLERGRHILLGIEEWIFRERSEFQEVAIARVPDYGKGLFLDSVVEVLELDEFVYHEAFALPPLLFHPAPKRVLIEGGGDGLALREVLRDPRAEEVVMVEIDELVIEACRAHLPELHQGSFEDPRAKIIVGDVFPYLESSSSKFDVILVDLLDGYDAGSLSLYERVLPLTRDALAPGGIVGGFGDLSYPHILLRHTFQGLSRLFEHTAVHRASVQTFSGSYGFVLASSDVDFRRTSTKSIQRRAGALTGELRSLVPDYFPACFALPAPLERALTESAPPMESDLSGCFSWLFPDEARD